MTKIQYRALEDFAHDPKLAEALGNMVAAWAHAEIMLFSTFARATGVGLNMAMESFARIPTFESRTKFLRCILDHWKTDKFNPDEISTAVTKLAKLASTRNRWVHGDWCATTDKKETVVFNHRVHPTSSERRKPVKASDISGHCAAVKLRTQHLGKLIKYEALDA